MSCTAVLMSAPCNFYRTVKMNVLKVVLLMVWTSVAADVKNETAKYGEAVHLIFVSTHNIFRSTDLLMDTPISVYSTNQTINDVSINIRTNILYILDSSGSVLSMSNNNINVLLTTKKEILINITIDWLKDLLYILMASTNENTTVYCIKQFDLQQQKIEEIFCGFDSKPLQIEVDPLNEFLFWTTKLGLYRLDISKNLKNLDMDKSRIILCKDIGPFVIDYLNVCLLVIFRKENTIMSVSLDGQYVINIRNNTHTALFADATALVYVNELFYWSNGSVIMREDYFIDDHKYYQTIYPDIHFKVSLIISNFTDQQPLKFPRNSSQTKNHLFMSKVKHEFNSERHNLWYEYRRSDEPWIILISGLLIICLVLIMLIKYCSNNFTGKNMPQRPMLFFENMGYQSVALSSQKRNNELLRIKRKQITFTKRLGSGAFGEVFEGKVKDIKAEAEYCVALKSLKEGSTGCELLEFLKEAKLMNNLKHKNILEVLGVCLDNEPNFIIMELMKEGDLLSYLRKTRPPTLVYSLSHIDYIRMCIDVAEGCSYLEYMHLVHRDLAARNCLVSSADPKEQIIKIGDFGLARKMYAHDYYRKEGEALLPVRWMSPESLVDGVYTSQSDVWAFGVLLWEIMSLGHQPYPGLSNIKAMHFVQHGGRLEKPINCPKTLYNLMNKCWHVLPAERPAFKLCVEILKSYYKVVEYTNNRDIELQTIPESEYLNL